MSWWTLLKWEWFKLRGRRIIWALLAVIVVFSSLIVIIRYADYEFQKDRDVVDEIAFLPGSPEADEVSINCTELVEQGIVPTVVPAPYTVDQIDVDRTLVVCRKEIADIQGRIDKLVRGFTLPAASEQALRWTELLSIPFLAFMTVLIVGSEYGWGTLRTTLMRGTGRWRLLSVKLAVVGMVLAVMWIVVFGVIVGTSLVTTALSDTASHGSWTAAATRTAIGDVGRAWFAGVPYVALAAMLTVLFSSWAGGTLAASGLSFGYFFFDMFTSGRLIKLLDGVDGMRWFGDLIEYDLGWNTAAWLFGRSGEPISGFNLVGAIGQAGYPGELHSFLVQAAYAALFLGVAFWQFQKRDVTGPSG